MKILSLINLEILYFLFVCDESFITQEEQNDSALNREGPARAKCSHPWKRTIQCLRLRLLYYSVSVYPRQRTRQFYQTCLMKIVPIFTERPSTVIASQKDEYLLIFSDFNSTPLSSLPLNAMIHPIPFAGPYPVLQHKIKNHRKEKNSNATELLPRC